MFKFAARTIVVVGLAAALAACSYQPRGPRLANLANKVPVEQAFMSTPPGGPQPIAVIEQRFSNGVLQEIILDNPTSSAGQNVLVVRAFGPMGDDRGMERMGLDEPTVSDIRREMRERFPGVAMQISNTYVQNRYGPFGFATGQFGRGVSCIYAWQEIRAKKSVLLPGYRGAVTWRLRMCGHATARELLYLVYGLNINVYFLANNWNIFGGDLPEPNPDIGKLGTPLGPDKVVEDLSMAPPVGYGEYRNTRKRSRSSTRSTTRRVTTTTGQPLDLANEPAIGAAVVPTPGAAEKVTPPTIRPSGIPTPQAPSPSSSQAPIQRAPSITPPTTSQGIPRPQAPTSSGPTSALKPSVRAPSLPAPTTSTAIPTPSTSSGGGSSSVSGGGSSSGSGVGSPSDYADSLLGSGGGSSSLTSDGVRQVGPSTNLVPAPKAPQSIR